MNALVKLYTKNLITIKHIASTYFVLAFVIKIFALYQHMIDFYKYCKHCRGRVSRLAGGDTPPLRVLK